MKSLRLIIPTEQEITYLSKELEERDTEQEIQIPKQFILLFPIFRESLWIGVIYCKYSRGNRIYIYIYIYM